MSAPNLTGNFEALSLEGFADFLRFCDEGLKRHKRIHRLGKPGIYNAYVKGELAIRADFDVPYPPHQFSLVFIRVPPGSWDRKTHRFFDMDVAVPDSVKFGSNRQSEIVLAVGDHRNNPHQVISRGVPITSSVWLVRPYRVPQPGVYAGIFEPPVEIIEIVRPRVMEFTPLTPKQGTGGVQRLIKAMPGMKECVGGFSLDVLIKLSGDLDLLDLLAGVRVSLDENVYEVTFPESLKESGRCAVKFAGSYFCPTDGLLGDFEASGPGHALPARSA